MCGRAHESLVLSLHVYTRKPPLNAYLDVSSGTRGLSLYILVVKILTQACLNLGSSMKVISTELSCAGTYYVMFYVLFYALPFDPLSHSILSTVFFQF